MRRVHTLQCLAILFTLAFPGACAGLMKGIVHTSGWLESCPNAKALLLQEIAGFLQAVRYACCVISLGLGGFGLLFALLGLLASGPSSPE